MQGVKNAMVNVTVASGTQQDGGGQVEVLHKFLNGIGLTVMSVSFGFGGGQQC